MDPALKKLLYFRYRSVIFIIVVLIFGIYFFQTISDITNWKSSYTYFSTEKAKKDFELQIQNSYDYPDEDQGSVFLYYDLTKEKTIYTRDFEEYRHYSLVMFNAVNDANQLFYNAYPFYNEHFLIFLIMFGSAGVFLFLFDLRSQFTATLFSSKFKRSEIYWTKYCFIGGALAGSLFIAKLISLVAYRFFIPTEYLNISLTQHFLSTFSGWLTLVGLFLISGFIGLLFGEWIFGIGAIIIFYFTFSNFLESVYTISETLSLHDSEAAMIVTNNNFDRVFPLMQSSIQKNNLALLATIVILGIFSLFIGKKVFDSISLETTGNFILVPKYNRLLQIIFILYFMIIFSSSTILVTVFPNEPLSWNSLIFNILKILGTFVALFLITEYILFNNSSKIIKKINIFN